MQSSKSEAAVSLIDTTETGELLAEIEDLIAKFLEKAEPVESENFYLFRDRKTGALYAECHVRADKLIALGTVDVALDPDKSEDYRANRNLVDDHAAYAQMLTDAAQQRSFSNLVCEFVDGDDLPLQVIGGQHRFHAIQEACQEGINELHGVKVYFGLDKEQRLDVQVISNTNISVSKDLLDRMYETVAGSELRDWCQSCGLLDIGQDFADKKERGKPLTVKSARTFIANFYEGLSKSNEKFDTVSTTPLTIKSGIRNPKGWDETKIANPSWASDPALLEAAKNYAILRGNQEAFYVDSKTGKFKPGSADSRDKANNDAVLAAWAYVAGLLQVDKEKLKSHFALGESKKGEPLKADVLGKGRHVTDPEAYRGLGYRTDPQERGRFVELFWLQAEKASGISAPLVKAAVETYHAKQANLRAAELKAKI